MSKIKWNWFVLIMVFVATGLNFLDRQVLSIVIIRIQEEFSMSDVQYGMINTSFLIGYGIMFTVAGRLIDTVGSKAGLAASVGVWSIANCMHGLVDNVTSAYELVPKMKAADLDLIFCDMLTYATSNIFGIVIKSMEVPIVLVALQPDKAMDYTKASTYIQLYNDDICSLPEFTGVAVRMGKKVPPLILIK